MTAGKLRHRITFQRVTLTSDGQGGQEETWADYTTIWADVETQENVTQSKEATVANEKVTTIAYKVKVRYRTDLVPSMRIKWGNRLMYIRNVLDLDNRKRYLQIFADYREV